MYNLGKVKYILSSIIGESFLNQTEVSKNGKLLKEFITTIKKSPLLRLENIVYKNFESKVLKNENIIDKYINENSLLFNSFTLKDFDTSHKLLEKFNIEFNIPQEKIDLYESIETLIKSNLKKSNKEISLVEKNKNIDKLLESYTYLVNHLKTDKASLEVTSEDTVIEEVIEFAIKKFNSKYSNLNEQEKLLMKIAISDKSDEQNEYYLNLVNEVTSILQNNLDSEKDNEIKEDYQLALDKIDSIKETFSIENAIELIELKDNLS